MSLPATYAALVVFALAASCAFAARADDTTEAAQKAFEQAQSHMKKKEYAEACALFEKSLAIQHAIGANYMLAECHEKLGRVASAWRRYLEVARESDEAGQTERASYARDRAAEVKKRVPTITLRLSAEVKALRGMEVRLDGERIRTPGAAIPVDPGHHEVEVRAPGYEARAWPLELTADGKARKIAVDALTPEEQEDDGAPGTLVYAGIGVGAAGVVLVGVSLGLAFAAKGKYDDTLADHCVDLICDEEGVSTTEDARTQGTWASVLFAVGGVATAAGIGLVVVGVLGEEPEDVAIALSVTPGAIGVEASGRFR